MIYLFINYNINTKINSVVGEKQLLNNVKLVYFYFHTMHTQETISNRGLRRYIEWYKYIIYHSFLPLLEQEMK